MTQDNQPLTSELKKNRQGRVSKYTPEQRAQRSKQAARAQTLALAVLRQRHQDEYQELYDQAKREIGLVTD